MRLAQHPSHQVDYSKSLNFIFNNKRYKGFEGDTLASALLANDALLFTRSFKYGRKRGLMTAGVEEPNALVSLEIGGRYTPNLKATEIMLYDGLSAVSASNPNAFDMRAFIKPLHRFMPAGFYYKTFIKQKVWAKVEDSIRAFSGFSKAPTEEDVDVYDHIFHHAEVVVIGGGAAGISAALEVLNNSQKERVILVDERTRLGGELFNEFSSDEAAMKWHKDSVNRLLSFANEDSERFTLLTQSTAYAWHDQNYIEVLETITTAESLTSSETQKARKIIHRIRAKEVILATGAHERPMLFEANDLTNIMLSQSVRRYLHEYGVISGKKVVIYGNNDSIYCAARDLHVNGIECIVVDVRSSEDPIEIVAELKHSDVKVLQGYSIVKALGSHRVKGVEIVQTKLQGNDWQVFGDTQTLSCDLVATSGGFNPVVHLDCHNGAKTYFDEVSQSFLPQQERDNREVCGAVAGAGAWQDAINDGKNKAQFTLNALGAVSKLTQEILSENYSNYFNVSQFFTPKEILNKPKVFLDLQNDVTTLDVALSIREGYRSIEHIKRYTAMGFGTDQGKTGNINGIAVAAEMLGISMSEVGTTTFRPAYTGVDFGAMAGREIGDFFDPQRYTTIHDSHVASGAEFEVVGQWYRPWYYPKTGENIHQAVHRECLAARTSLGMMDASTLGKIDVQGRDAREFLSRIYTNAWMKLPVGKARYGVMLREDGIVFDDGTTTRISENHFHMTTTTAQAVNVLAHLEYYLQVVWPELAVYVLSTTEQWAGAALAGPNSRNLLNKLFPEIDVSNEAIPFMGYEEADLFGVPARIFRISFSGELAYEVNVESGYGIFMWEKIIELGKEMNIEPYGTEALSTLRIEMGHVAGSEIDGRVISSDLSLEGMLSKKKDFIGKRSLNREAFINPNREKIVGVVPLDKKSMIPEGSYLVRDSNASLPNPKLGYISASCWSVEYNNPFSLAILKDGKKRIGEKLFALSPLKNKKIEVEIVSSHYVDSKGERVRS